MLLRVLLVKHLISRDWQFQASYQCERQMDGQMDGFSALFIESSVEMVLLEDFSLDELSTL